MEKFIKFLEKNKAWENFEKAFKEAGRDAKEYARMRKEIGWHTAISSAFTWAETDQGQEYWLELSDKWEEECNSLKEKLIKEYNKL